MILKRLIVSSGFLWIVGCGVPVNQLEQIAPGGDAAAGVMTLFANVAGTLQSTFLTALQRNEFQPNPMIQILNQIFNFAHATVTDCSTSVASDSCSGGTKMGAYANCNVGATTRKFSGTISLTFSDPTCAFTAAGQTVTRTSELVRTVNAFDSFTTRTGARNDYRGTSFGGGTQFIKTAGGYELNVVGFNKYYTAQSGATSRDVSIKSTTNITVTDPRATSITFNSGSLEVVDSVKKFVATYVPTSVVVNYTTCCYPTSGTMDVTYLTGTLTGVARVEFFSSCGSAILTANDTVATVPLWGCQ